MSANTRFSALRRWFRRWKLVLGGLAALATLVATIADYTGAPVGEVLSRWWGDGAPPAEEKRRELRSFLRERLRDGTLSTEDRRAAIDFSAARGIDAEIADTYSNEVLPALIAGSLAVTEGAEAANRQDFRTARDHFHRATEFDPESPAAWANLGGANLELGALAAAEAALRRALVLEPDSVAAHYNLGSCLAGQGQNATALDHLERALMLLEAPGQMSGLDRRTLAEDLRGNPLFAPVRASKRFAALVERASSS